MNKTSNLAGRFLLPVCLGIASLVSTPSADAQLVIIDGFELGEGHFTSNPNTGSGTTQGFIETGPTAATADQTFATAFTGSNSQRIVIFDDIAAGGTPANVDSWRFRHLSGAGTPANNLSLAIVTGSTGFVGYWLKTSSAGLEAGIGIDDGLALEIGRWQPIIADGQWHLYEWQFQDAVDWDAFAGTGPNGQIDAASVTIDSVFIRAGVGVGIGTAFDADFVIDDVSYNPTGSAVPEPSSMLLIGLASLSCCLRRWRR
jgi:hypothetical protein